MWSFCAPQYFLSAHQNFVNNIKLQNYNSYLKLDGILQPPHLLFGLCILWCIGEIWYLDWNPVFVLQYLKQYLAQVSYNHLFICDTLEVELYMYISSLTYLRWKEKIILIGVSYKVQNTSSAVELVAFFGTASRGTTIK